MSRGIGRVQRQVLDALQSGEWLTARQLAEAVYEATRASDHQVMSTRRAIHGLRERGLVQVEFGDGDALRRRHRGGSDTEVVRPPGEPADATAMGRSGRCSAP